MNEHETGDLRRVTGDEPGSRPRESGPTGDAGDVVEGEVGAARLKDPARIEAEGGIADLRQALGNPTAASGRDDQPGATLRDH